MRASVIGLRHLGQVSFMNRSKDMVRPFVASVAEVLAPVELVAKTLEMLFSRCVARTTVFQAQRITTTITQSL